MTNTFGTSSRMFSRHLLASRLPVAAGALSDRWQALAIAVGAAAIYNEQKNTDCCGIAGVVGTKHHDAR